MPDPRRVDQPEPGFFRIKLVKGGPPVAAAIVHDADGWHAVIDGDRLPSAEDPWHAEGLARVWHYGLIIDEPEYRFMLARAAHARAHDPTHPTANPDQPINLADLPPLF